MTQTLDLSFGHPLYLSAYWNWQTFSPTAIPAVSIVPSDGLGYGTSGGEKRLIDRIFELHCYINNAQVIGAHILIGNGATQLLNAAVAQSPFDLIYSRNPHFFRFEQIFALNNKLPIYIPDASGDFTEIVTHPSNPENLYYPETSAKFKIHDLSYNWPQYGTVIKQDKSIMIFSMAKATGNAGSRIGWAIIKDKHTYERMSEYVEASTGGVSFEAQLRAENILREQANRLWIQTQAQQAGGSTSPSHEDVFSFGKRVLSNRWDALLAIDPTKIKFLNNSGMFAWCEIPGEPDAAAFLLNKYNVKGLSGPVCGGQLCQVRLNIGCSQDYFAELIRRIK